MWASSICNARALNSACPALRCFAWVANTQVYEDVRAEECVELPYADVSEAQWAATVVLSWRWGAPKPAAAQPGFSPMLPTQFAELVTALTRLQDAGFTYVWIDW